MLLFLDARSSHVDGIVSNQTISDLGPAFIPVAKNLKNINIGALVNNYYYVGFWLTAETYEFLLGKHKSEQKIKVTIRINRHRDVC